MNRWMLAASLAVAFGSGWLLGRSDHSQNLAQDNVDKSGTSRSHATELSRFSAAPVSAGGLKNSTASGDAWERSQPVQGSRASRVESAKNLEELTNKETESALAELVRDSSPAHLKNVSEKPSPGGAVEISGTSEDGKDFFRHINPRGELTYEGWSHRSSGESVYKTYYENGDLKLLTWKRGDQSATTITYNQSGVPETRNDRLADGTNRSIIYDDEGEVLKIWEILKDGKKRQIYPAQ